MNSNLKFKILNLKNIKNLINLVIINLFILNLQTGNAQMFWNHAASFAGNSSSYIKCRNSPSLNIAGSFTLEAWINPSTLSGFSKGIIAKGAPQGSSLIYGMRLEPTGRIIIATNGSVRLRSKVSTTVPVNQWTHVAATFNFSTGLFSFFFNGQLDTTASSSGAAPIISTDTLFFGVSGSSTPFAGMMDEIRIWSRALASTEIRDNWRTSISAFGGVYSGLSMTLTFQTPFSNVLQFNVNDWSAFFNTCININVNDVDLSDVPSQTICINEALVLDGLDDYISGPDNQYISPTNQTTLQAWIYPKSNSDAIIIHKGTANGSTTNYSLNIISKKLAAKINGTVFDSGDSIKVNQWSHVSFSYSYTGTVRSYRFIVNGKLVKTGFGLGGSNISDGSDSLYIGGTIGLPDFQGYIDEVRISRYSKSLTDIQDSMFIPMEVNPATNMTSVAYSFDGYSRSGTTLGPNLNFRNQAMMAALFIPISPLDKGYTLNFQKGFIIKNTTRRIPETGNTGIIFDTLNVFLDENISDVNVFVSLEHNNSEVLEIDLIGPDGSSVRIFDNNQLLSNNESVVTSFDDDAATTISNFKFTSFSPRIKPVNNLNSVFSGKASQGLWKLKINDTQNSDTGRLYEWGIQFNNKSSLPKVLSCKSLIQGFYDAGSNTTILDTMTCYIRNNSSPYAIIDSAKDYVEAVGTGTFTYNNPGITNLAIYYISILHRNSIETWSSSLIGFDNFGSQASYDFTTDSTKAYGNNVIQINNSPVKFANYGGDVNQDGFVDATDAGAIDNDASNFVTGYVNSDVTGDNFVDASDASLVDNNAANFVTKVTP
ncbi:MAG: LamG-like jellyroll fold domain-containing protein [Ignavibacteria bacterium]